MADDSLTELRNRLKSLVGEDPSYQGFLNSIAAAEEEIARLHRRDLYGRIPRMTRQDREKLMRLHREIGMKAETVLQSGADRPRKELVKKITALAAGNHRALVNYDPEKAPKTLPALLAEVRSLTLDTRGAALKTKLNGSTNARQPLTFLDSKGREFTGVFTPKQVIRGLGEAVRDQVTDSSVNLLQGKNPDDSRIDNRSAAMSAAADLLGVPNLLARSRSMKLITRDGREVEGTFTQEARGLDPENLDEQAAGVNENALRRDTPDDREAHGKALKSLSDLQILDYICGNVDRQQRNMCYQFDREGRFIGVQGIGNDCAFGLGKPEPYSREQEPPAIQVISESMYRTVKDLTPQALRFTLRGFHLSEEELEAACHRLNTLKTELQKSDEYFKNPDPNRQERFPQGYIRRVRDADWSGIGCSELAKYSRYRDSSGSLHTEAHNVFAEAAGAVSKMNESYREQKKGYQSLRGAAAIGDGNRAVPTELPKEAEGPQRQNNLLQP